MITLQIQPSMPKLLSCPLASPKAHDVGPFARWCCAEPTPTPTPLLPTPQLQQQGFHRTLLFALCPCSQVQVMRSAHLLDGAVPPSRSSSTLPASL